jgi:hypothetical protein
MAAVLLGEWWQSNVLFGGVFLVVAVGIFGLAWYVIRGDRLNRLGMDEEQLGVGHGQPDEPDDLKPPPAH